MTGLGGTAALGGAWVQGDRASPRLQDTGTGFVTGSAQAATRTGRQGTTCGSNAAGRWARRREQGAAGELGAAVTWITAWWDVAEEQSDRLDAADDDSTDGTGSREEARDQEQLA